MNREDTLGLALEQIDDVLTTWESSHSVRWVLATMKPEDAIQEMINDLRQAMKVMWE